MTSTSLPSKLLQSTTLLELDELSLLELGTLLNKRSSYRTLLRLRDRTSGKPYLPISRGLSWLRYLKLHLTSRIMELLLRTYSWLNKQMANDIYKLCKSNFTKKPEQQPGSVETMTYTLKLDNLLRRLRLLPNRVWAYREILQLTQPRRGLSERNDYCMDQKFIYSTGEGQLKKGSTLLKIHIRSFLRYSD